ncbi:50S ribosomal protein L4 [Candidatus Woesearchaeota archaeon CG10_big_fil_rev_8_21_14_0_10_45_16]|nr:MAG: 50S ribosomal protein L4 [Candidatus Woesearchaeota archaeon CG10_big_fil_rev_8_21_14_0_10_45_16]
MKLPIYTADKNKSGERELPSQFSEPFRPDLIKRAVLALQSSARQQYGADPEAGFRHSSKLSKRRRNYRGCYGLGISRVNRKIHSRRGTRMSWVGTFSPQTRGGRRAHPPKSIKVWEQQINKKENRKAIRSALAATIDKTLVAGRGHILPAEYPFILDSTFENAKSTKEVNKVLQALGFAQELERSLVKKIRAGLGKMRGRRYRQKKSILLVVSGECPLMKAAKNVPGLDIVPVNALNAEVLAPGAMPGRVTLWTDKAVEVMKEKKLFI